MTAAVAAPPSAPEEAVGIFPQGPVPLAGDCAGVGGVVEIARAGFGCHRGDRLRVVGESRKLWKVEGGKNVPKEHQGIGWTWVLRAEEEARAVAAAAARALAELAPPRPAPGCGLTTACVGGYVGYVIDGALGDAFLAALDEARLGLPLDTSKKKTAAARRFFHDASGWVCGEVERALARALPASAEGAPRVYPWMRFLEYHEAEGALPPHTDALVRCKDTGRWSTHTLILFGSDCARGGDTVMLPSGQACCCGHDRGSAGFAVRPVRGRLFCFPHQCLHEGRPTVAVPKILLRAEVLWTSALCGR